MYFKFDLGKPEHGWVNCSLAIGNHCYEFEASDVPNNPIQELFDSLPKLLKGEKVDLWWHLEPSGYYFEIEPFDNKLRFTVLFSSDSRDINKKLLSETLVGRRQVLLAFWRGIAKFSSYNVIEPHWPKVTLKEIAKLKALIKEQDNDS